MPKDIEQHRTPTQIPLQIHPRVFGALGADLVTNDVVAVIELVKNSYDAFATRVDVRFGTDTQGASYLDIQDDGHGMTRRIIERVWCLVATPYRRSHAISKRGSKTRRVAGEKGLGRLSTARLGDRVEMLTQAASGVCWKVTVDWSEIAKAKSLDQCSVTCVRYRGRSPFIKSGTRVRVCGLRTDWSPAQIDDLEDNLGRLVPPFKQLGGFSIVLSAPGREGHGVLVQPHAFLAYPKYSIKGKAHLGGRIVADYKFAPIGGGRGRSKRLTLDSFVATNGIPEEKRCGPFSFEIRAWDIAGEDTAKIAEEFDLKKSLVRKAIGAHKGLSIYRDGILVLPKSEGARDWLGLDLRRVSKIGTRLSTTQIVGYVEISGDTNRAIEDTSDRERLVDNPQVLLFQSMLKTIVAALENERDSDRRDPTQEKPLVDLLADLSADELVEEVADAAEEDALASEALPLVRDFGARLRKARKSLEKRLTYYSRLATIGTITEMLIHEVRNQTTVIDRFLRTAESAANGGTGDGPFVRQLHLAQGALESLEELADTFAPLATRSFKRRKRSCQLSERILRCLVYVARDIKRLDVDVSVPSQADRLVAVDPAELEAIILNLLTNALYWLEQSRIPRQMQIRVTTIQHGERVRVAIHDSGPGIADEDTERVFWPGVTRKPGGVGMGLTIASELVEVYGGQMYLEHPGKLGGASFTFDLPIK